MSIRVPKWDDPQDEYDVPRYVYCCYDADEWLLYVGFSKQVEWRLYHHSMCYNAAWPLALSRVDAYGPFTDYDARSVERRAIRDLAPIFNFQDNDRLADVRREWPYLPEGRATNRRGRHPAPVYHPADDLVSRLGWVPPYEFAATRSNRVPA